MTIKLFYLYYSYESNVCRSGALFSDFGRLDERLAKNVFLESFLSINFKDVKRKKKVLPIQTLITLMWAELPHLGRINPRLGRITLSN